MSDFGNQFAQKKYYENYIAAAAGSIASNVSITTGQTAATLASIPAGIVHSGHYNIAATGIPASTTFIFKNSTAITLSQAATATNATAAGTITAVIGG